MSTSTSIESSDWTLWQLIDSAFPIGGFAHSGGLEAAVQLTEITSAETLTAFIDASLHQCARWLCPYAEAVRADTNSFSQHDRLLDVTLTNAVANRASRAQGQSLLGTAEAVWKDPAVTAAREMLRGGAPGHWPTCFGLIAATRGLSAPAAAEAILFIHLRGLISAAVRLGVIGPLEAQRIQSEFAPRRQSLLTIATDTTIETASTTAPLADLLQAQHDRLYSRLFMS